MAARRWPGTHRASSGATGGRRGSIAGTTSSWASPTRCRGRATTATTTSCNAIANDWQVNGVLAAFSGNPFTVTASGTSLNTPSNQQNGRPRRHVQRAWNIGASGQWFDTVGIRAANRRPVRDHRPGPVLRSRAVEPGLLPVPFVPGRRTRRLEYRLQAANLLNHPVFGNPSTSVTSGTFGQITGSRATANISSGRFRWVCALAFRYSAGSTTSPVVRGTAGLFWCTGGSAAPHRMHRFPIH